MKTLADLKRDLKVGVKIKMIFNHNEGNSERIKQYMQVERYIVKTKSNGVEISKNKEDKKGSFLDFPKASLTEYKDNIFTIYGAGFREMTKEEKRIRDNVPSHRKENKEAVMQEALCDGSGFDWKDKQYYKDNNAEYLAGHETVRGLCYHYNTEKIEDDTIKGEKELAYEIIS